MRLIHSTGFKAHERKGFRNVIFQNIVEAFLMMFDIMDAQKTAFEDPENQVSCGSACVQIVHSHLWLLNSSFTALRPVSRTRTRTRARGKPSNAVFDLLQGLVGRHGHSAGDIKGQWVCASRQPELVSAISLDLSCLADFSTASSRRLIEYLLQTGCRQIKTFSAHDYGRRV